MLSFMMIFSLAVDGPIEEYAAKSIFLFNMCKYTQWPESSEMAANPYRPIVIAVLGKLPEGKAISIPGSKTIQKRSIQVISIITLEEVANCDVLYIAASEFYRIYDIMARVADKPILTVGDAAGFCKKGVILSLFVKNNKINFEFNPGAARKAKIQMNSFFYVNRVLVKTEADPAKSN